MLATRFFGQNALKMASRRCFSSNIRYTKFHEYMTPLKEEGTFRVGITPYAASALGDIVFVDLPTESDKFEKGQPVCAIESVKSAADCYAPAAGSVIRANDALGDAPELVNADPLGEGWMFEFRVSDAAGLADTLDEAAYAAFVADLE
eukprot:TRINITY_DN6030_c0_g1_i1.p1 TRINITY_DN6030_c0_g1~~TRINITY_DN6030_c0_g1_i1.p1  ORF type:complete len:168 (+),score=38.18 TRINITY_DN6030_c0_g1_i1:62-505(+)